MLSGRIQWLLIWKIFWINYWRWRSSDVVEKGGLRKTMAKLKNEKWFLLRVGFEPTPFRTRTLIWRLRPTRPSQLVDDSCDVLLTQQMSGVFGIIQNWCYFFFFSLSKKMLTIFFFYFKKQTLAHTRERKMILTRKHTPQSPLKNHELLKECNLALESCYGIFKVPPIVIYVTKSFIFE